MTCLRSNCNIVSDIGVQKPHFKGIIPPFSVSQLRRRARNAGKTAFLNALPLQNAATSVALLDYR